MKFNISKAKQKIFQISICITLLISVCIATRNKITNKASASIIIENQLDVLINKLENQVQLSNSTKTTNEKENEKIVFEKPEIRKKAQLQDEVVNALNDLNKDFVEYDMILSKEKSQKKSTTMSPPTPSKDAEGQSKKNYTEVVINKSSTPTPIENKVEIKVEIKKEEPKKEEVKKEDNIIIDSSKNYLNEVKDLTSNIDNSLNDFDAIDGYNKEKKVLEQKINHINAIKESVNNLKGEIDGIKKDKKIVKTKISSIKNISQKLMSQYHQYLEIRGNKDKEIQRDLKVIKMDLQKSFTVNNNIDDFLKTFAKIIIFNRKIDTENFDDLNKKMEKFADLVKTFNKKDILNSNLIKKIEAKLSIVKKNFSKIPEKQRIIILDRYITLLKKLKNHNDNIISTKNKIAIEYKNSSFNKITNIFNILNFKKNKFDQARNHLKNFQTILERKNLIKHTRENIMDTVGEINLIEKISKLF